MSKVFFDIKPFAIILCLILGANAAKAQQYITAAGARISDSHLGITIQQRLLPKTTGELIAAATLRDVRGTAIIQKHFGIITDGLNGYVGIGAHAGIARTVGKYAGADAMVGVEWKIPAAKWLVSIDLNPALHVGYTRTVDMRAGLSVRKILVGEPVFKNKKNIFGNKKSKSKSKKLW